MPITISLGFWQLSRGEEKQALLEEYQQRELADPVPIAEVDFSSAQLYRRVHVLGKLDNEHNVLLENRINKGRPGYEVLTLMELDGGLALWVNRGWLAGSLNRSDIPTIPPVTGEVMLTGHLYRQLKAPFTVGEEIWRQQWPQVFQNYTPQLLSSKMQREFAPYIVRLEAHSPGALLVDWQIVNVMPEKHLGYAVQWFLMASALVILSLFANTNIASLIKHRRQKSLAE